MKENKNIPEIIADLRAGRLDAGAFDDMVAGVHAQRPNPSLPIQLINYTLPISDYAVERVSEVRQQLRSAFDDADRHIMLTACLTSVLTKWGLTPADRFEPLPNCCVPAALTRRPGQC